jgi:hypothetical protein
VTTVTALPRHLRQLFLLADVLLFQVIDRLTIPSTQLVHYTHSQNKHNTKNYSLVVLSQTASQYLDLKGRAVNFLLTTTQE